MPSAWEDTRNRFPFRTIAERFRLIEENTRTVYLPYDEGRALVERLEEGERSRALFRKLGPYSVSVYDNHFGKLNQAGALTPLEDGSAVLTDMSLYDEKTGLTLTPEGGNAWFIEG